MNSLTDQQLLRDYAGRRSEPAFAELVRRHLDLVHSAALRMVRDPHLAQDVTQAVFVALAQNAPQLTDRSVLSGWLHRTAQNLAANAVRSTVRRRAREQEAAAMNELLAHQSDASWEHVAPHLDAALGELPETDRDALLLRYFERKTAREMALTLGVSEDAAQKRVTRAVERLREFFAKRGVTIGAGGLVVVISANAVQAAPVGLAATITAAVIAGTTIVSAATATTAKAIAMTTFQKAAITVALATTVSAGIYEAHQAFTLRTQVQTLEQQQAPLAGQIEQLQQERSDLTNRLALLASENAVLNSNSSELLRLRSELTQLRYPPPQTRVEAPGTVGDALNIFADMTHQTVLHGYVKPFTNSVIPRMMAEPQKAAEILDEELWKQGLRLVPDGEKFVQILPESEGMTPRASPPFQSSRPSEVATASDQTISFTGINLNSFLGVLGSVSGRVILRPSNLPMVTVAVRSAVPLTRDEMLHAMCVVLSLNGFTVMPDGDKFVEVVTAREIGRVHANAPAAEPGAVLIDPADVPIIKASVTVTKPGLPQLPATPPPPATVTLDDFMVFYAKQLDKTFLPSKQFAGRSIVFEVKIPLTKAELLYAIETTLAMNELAIESVDGKSIRLVGVPQTRPPGKRP